MKRIISTIIFLSVIGFVVYLLLAPREKRGTEFCPQTFEVRSFEFKANAFRSFSMDRLPPIPLVGNSIAKHLKPFDAALMPKQWDLIEGIDLEAKTGNAQILNQYLDATSASSAWKLEEWSQKHPNLAAELWPRVQTLAIHNLYFAIPELIDHALKEPSVAEFKVYADKNLLKAGYNQLLYLISLKPSHDNRVRLLRLVNWLDGWLNSASEVIDLQMQQEMTPALLKAKLMLAEVKDAMLSNEELPKNAAAATQ